MNRAGLDANKCRPFSMLSPSLVVLCMQVITLKLWCFLACSLFPPSKIPDHLFPLKELGIIVGGFSAAAV